MDFTPSFFFSSSFYRKMCIRDRLMAQRKQVFDGIIQFWFAELNTEPFFFVHMIGRKIAILPAKRADQQRIAFHIKYINDASVSYTHLDVYKRQHIRFICWRCSLKEAALVSITLFNIITFQYTAQIFCCNAITVSNDTNSVISVIFVQQFRIMRSENKRSAIFVQSAVYKEAH